MKNRAYTITFLVLLSVFFLDATTPLGAAEWLLYLLPVIFLSRYGSRPYLIIFLAITTLLIIAGLFLSPQDMGSSLGALNRIGFICILWAVSLVYQQGKESALRLRNANRTLREREASLRQTATRLSLAQEAGQVGVFDWDMTTNNVFWTPEMEAIFDLPQGAFENRYEGWAKRVHPDDLPRVEALLAEWMQSDRAEEQWEYRFLRKGEERWIEARGRIFRDPGGKPVRMIGTNLDVTERKRAEEALKLSEEKLQYAVQAAQVGIWDLNVTDHTAWRSLQHDEIFGYHRLLPKWTYEMFLDHVLPEDWAEVDALFRRAVEGRTEWNFECRIRRTDGEIRWIWAQGIPFVDSRGTLARLRGIVQDITERKRAEEALKRSEALLRETQRLSKVGGWELDVSSGKIAWTEEVYRIYGVSKDFETGNIPAAMSFYHPDSLPLLEEAFAKALEQGEPYDLELKFINAQGEHLWVRTVGNPIRDNGRAVRISGNIMDITEQKRMEEEIRHLAHHDSLTGLPNRLLFMDILRKELAHAHRSRKKLAVFFLDLDRFKYINDTLGHDVGDRLLKKVASRLRASVRESDTVSRTGGDEFNILLTDLTHAGDIVTVARNILHAFLVPCWINGHELHVAISMGISIYPDDAQDSETLLKNADIALYHTKGHGGNNYRFYDASMNIHTLERVRLEHHLRQSLTREELMVYYQPQFSTDTRQIVCAEALVRWEHPELGILDPIRFIPLAEETGFIISIDEWVLREACAQFRQWQQEGYPDLCVTVNLSAKQFKKTDLAEEIARTLKETGLAPRHLTIEITESIAMEDLEHTILLLHRLVDIGIGISIDDFGTGSSSLSYLKRLPVNKLKIDQSFVRDIATDPDDRSIIKAITALAQSMRLGVIAEGVETEEQLEFLRAVGCREAQGYLFSRPLPPGEFKALVADGK